MNVEKWKEKQNHLNMVKRLKIYPRMNLLGIHKGDENTLKTKLTSKLERDVVESYAECYPGAPEDNSEYVSNKKTLSKAAV
ncbi:hypothetical protein NPIL_49231 [Nephila pilipes]|uniref:Uncharacterized protein n=1 Tax=Nephila pilipes TaxID=299642 RepID=A0A8X6I8T5_NEPPI|nr:hypothetical protein NPIL_49231 [Nephila pilipes]